MRCSLERMVGKMGVNSVNELEHTLPDRVRYAAKSLRVCLDSVTAVNGRLVYENVNETLYSPCLSNLRVINHTTGE
ncbi:hypothetical protein KIN20_011686 [Parelaphostrongylus tenuis]|uniref:Uncharacterized protein n=1 Tax=Parelaphostrongylus tenuis TaxID=148309 RepID=A0AAD5QQ13_PARTN|nr:hypothetical protein KIN20_011686 [Parelaphostrongylus tenuis]